MLLTFQLWWQESAKEVRQLTQLKKESARLIQLLAEAELEKVILKDPTDGNI